MTNDGGLTEAENPLALTIAGKLPRLLALMSPRKLFDSVQADLVFSGADLDVFGPQLLLKLL